MEKVKVKEKGKKGSNKVLSFLKKHLVEIGCLVVGIIIGISIMALNWPERVTSLKNGEEVIVTVDKKDFTANDYFQALKKEKGLDLLLNEIDLYILNKKYDLEKEAKKYAKDQAKTYYDSYKQYYGQGKDEFLSSNGFDSEEAFLEYLEKNYYFEHYYNEYLESKIKEKDIKDFYKKDVFGDKGIYILSSTEDKNDLAAAKKELDKGTDIKKVLKKYPSITSNEVESLKFKDQGSYSKEFIKQLKKLKAKDTSKIFKDDSFGQVLIYVDNAKKKPSLKDCKKDIISTIRANMNSEDPSLYYKAFIKLRDDANIEFKDSKLNEEYKEYLEQYK